MEVYGDDCKVTFSCTEDLKSTDDAGLGGGDSTGGSASGTGSADGTGGSPACSSSCTGDTPVCDEAAKECVGCLADKDCSGDAALCDSASQSCVACLDTTDCTDGAASVCESGACGACTTNDDCAHISGKGICDAGACVECTVATDDRESDTDDCGTGVCNPETNACDSTLTQDSKDICGSCIADNECKVGQGCIALQYTGGMAPVDMGGTCMKLVPGGCSSPYEAGAIKRESLSGAAATNYCGLSEEFTTCAAIADLKAGKLCASDADCGSEQGEGRCETVNFGANKKCTYSCTSSNQCVLGNDCNGASGNEYCGGSPP